MPSSRHHCILLAAFLLSACFEDSLPDSDETDDAGSDFGASSSTTTGLPTTISATTTVSSGTGSDTSGDPSTTTTDAGTSDTTDASSGDTGAADATTTTTTTGSEVLGIADLVPGDLVVTEIMWNPPCIGDNCEWIEVVSTVDAPINLQGLNVQDLDMFNPGVIAGEVLVEPGQRFVIAKGVTSWPYEFDPLAIYGPNPGLDNGDLDAVSLVADGLVIDETPTYPFDAGAGRTWSLMVGMEDAISNDEPSAWCLSDTPLPSSEQSDEFGTPAAPTGACL